MNEWISVKERMPNYGQEVLVYPYPGAFRRNNIGSLTVYNDGKGGSHFGHTYHDEITHWMPYPSPPEKITNE